MTVIAEITVPADTFTLGCIFTEISDVEITLERVVPLRDGIMPLLWISGDEPVSIEQTLRDHPGIDSVDQLTQTDSKTLFEVDWGADVGDLMQALRDSHAHVLEATGTADSWDFRLRFASHEELSAFNVALTGNNTPVTLRHLYTHPQRDDESTLSTVQRETLLQAHHQGYFKVPRRTTLTELADAEGISDSALSQRIRRAMDELVEQTLLPNDHPEQ